MNPARAPVRYGLNHDRRLRLSLIGARPILRSPTALVGGHVGACHSVGKIVLAR